MGFIPQRQQGPSTVHNLDDSISTPRHLALKKAEPFSSLTLRSVNSLGSNRNSFDNLFESLNFPPALRVPSSGTLRLLNMLNYGKRKQRNPAELWDQFPELELADHPCEQW